MNLSATSPSIVYDKFFRYKDSREPANVADRRSHVDLAIAMSFAAVRQFVSFAHGVSDSLTDDDLHEMVKRIIASSETGRARSRLSMTNPGFLILQANRDACMRIAAAALLEACRDERPEVDFEQIDKMSFEGLAELSQSEEQTLLGFNQIQKRKGDHTIRIIQKVEFDVNSDVIKTPHQKDFGDYVTIVGCSTVAILIVFLVVSGVLFWTSS